MPPSALTRSTHLLEVACDESGSEGEKLVRGSTDVFAHASVDVTTERALETIARVRVEARSPATEVKASVVLRPQNRRLLEWLLGEDAPLLGHAHVHLTDKALHLTSRLVRGLGVERDGDVEVGRVAARLHREASRRLGTAAWEAVLADFNDVVRARSLVEAEASARALHDGLRTLGKVLDGDGLGGLVAELGTRVPRDADGLAPLVGRGRVVLDPIVPAFADVLRRWGTGGRPLWVVHDVQATLTDDAIRTAVASRADRSSQSLEGISFVDSQDDPRVQMADFLAGAARRIASNVLAGHGDPRLVALIAPYVSARSTWLDTWPAGELP